MKKNFLFMMGGGVAAQGITVLALPLLSRLYSPENFGFLAAVMAVASICGSVVHGRYHMALPIARDPADPPDLLVLALLLSLFLSLPVVLIILAIIGKPWEGHSAVLFVLACFLVTFLTSIFDILGYWRSYRNRFAITARCLVLRSLLPVVTQLALSGLTGFGMVIGAIIGLGGAVLYSVTDFIRNDFTILERPAWARLRDISTAYRNFPVFGTPQGLMAALSQNMLPLMLLKYGGVAIAGHYWVAYRLLIAPLALFNNSYRQTVLREFGILKTKDAHRRMARHTLYLVCIGVLVVLTLWLFGIPTLVLFLGDGWNEAGRIAGFLSFAIAADLFKVPAICFLQSMHRQKQLMFWEFGIVAGRFGITLIFLWLQKIDLAILAFSITGLLGWSIFTLRQILWTQDSPQATRA